MFAKLDSGVYDQLLLLFVMMMIGFAAVKIKLISKPASDGISSLISRVTMPCMYIATFMAQTLTAERMKQCGITVGLSLFYYVMAIGVSFLFVALTKPAPGERGVYQFLIIFSNAAYMGFPVLRAILGEDAIFYGAFFNLPFNILAYSLGIWLLRRGRKDTVFSKKDMFLNPGTIGVGFGVLLFLLSPLFEGTRFFDIFYRGVIYQGFKAIGDTTVPLSMFVIGTVLATVKPGAVFGNFRVMGACLVRLIVCPLLMFLLLLPFQLESMTRSIPILISAMPCAVFCVILAKEYGGDEKTASVGVFLSTLASAVTIPLISLLL